MFIIIALIVGVVLFVGFIIMARMYDNLPFGEWDEFALGFGIIGSVVTGILLIILIICGFCYTGAKYKADIINRAYDTAYTAEEIFWAGDVINTVRKIQRVRTESTINLNIDKE